MTTIKIDEKTLRALMHAGEMLSLIVDTGDLSHKAVHIEAWQKAFNAVLAKLPKGKQ